jgi:hypothetical protein
MSDESFTLTETDLAVAIRGLREALGRSPEVMAQMVGCGLPAYQKWELGSAMPGGDWLLRLLQLCPNEETRNAFRIRAERRNVPRPPVGGATACAGGFDPESRRRVWEAARHALDTIYECADAGIQAADVRLVEFAEHLQGAAGHYAERLRQTRKS